MLTAKEQARVGKEQQPIIKNATFKKEEHSLEEEEAEDLLSAWPANVATLGCISSRLHDCASVPAYKRIAVAGRWGLGRIGTSQAPRWLSDMQDCVVCVPVDTCPAQTDTLWKQEGWCSPPPPPPPGYSALCHSATCGCLI